MHPAASRCLALKLGTQPDRVLLALMNDRMVAKGTILIFATTFFQVQLCSWLASPWGLRRALLRIVAQCMTPAGEARKHRSARSEVPERSHEQALPQDKACVEGARTKLPDPCMVQDYLATESTEELVSMLRKARMDTRLLELLPPQNRTLEAFDAHFKVPSHSFLCALVALQSWLAAK